MVFTSSHFPFPACLLCFQHCGVHTVDAGKLAFLHSRQPKRYLIRIIIREHRIDVRERARGKELGAVHFRARNDPELERRRPFCLYCRHENPSLRLIYPMQKGPQRHATSLSAE